MAKHGAATACRRPYQTFLLAVLFVLSLSSSTHAQFIDAVKLRELTRSLLKATSAQERTDLLAANKDLVSVALRRWLISEGTTLLAEGKYTQAIDAFKIATSVSEQIQDAAGIGTAALNTGTTLYLQGNYDGALQSYQKAREVFAQTKDQLELARALMGIGLVYKEQGKLAEGLNYLKQSQKEFEALGSAANSDELADVLNAIGSLYHRQGNYSEAVKVFENSLSRRDDAQSILRIAEAFYSQGNYLQALEYYEKVSKKMESETERNGPGLSIAVFGNLANVYYKLGNYDLSLQFYQKNLPLLERLSDRAGIALTLEGIGNVHRQQGDFGAALESYLLSVRNAEESGGRVSSATALNSIGMIRATQGNTAEAIDYFNQSLAEFERRGDNVGMGRALVNIGNSSYVLGDLPRAIESFQKALALREAMDDKSGTADVLLGLGTTYAAQQNFTVALETLRRGLAINEQIKDSEGMARILREMAKCYAFQKDHAQALVFIERAVVSARQAGSRDLEWRMQLDRGKYNQSLDRTLVARQAFEESIRLLEELQSASCTDFLYQTSPNDVIEPYAELVRLLSVDQANSKEMFLVFERGKSQAFRSIFRKDELRITRGLSVKEKQDEQRTFSSLLALETELVRERQRRVPDAKAVSAVQARLTQAQTACVASRRRMYARHPQLPIYRGELPQLKSVVDTTLFMPEDDTALLQFLVTDTTTYLFVFSRHPRSRDRSLRLEVYALQVQRGELATRIADFRQSIASHDDSVNEKGRQLYDLLLKPAEDLWKSKPKLLIAPDRELWALPFQALTTDQNRFLIEQAAISYVPSVTIGSVINKPTRLRTRRPPAPKSIMFVNPTVSEAVVRRVELTSGSSTLVSVPEQKPTASSKTLSAAHAREDVAKAEFASNSLINLATTTVIDDASPLGSYSVLSGGDADGLLHAWETMQLSSSAQIALMPFALPARNQTESGNGVMAMAWSWFVAGTPKTLISQWSADPDRTLELIERFRTLRTSPAVALQSATVSYLQTNPDHRHPYYWSGLRILGRF